MLRVASEELLYTKCDTYSLEVDWIVRKLLNSERDCSKVRIFNVDLNNRHTKNYVSMHSNNKFTNLKSRQINIVSWW